MINTRLHKRILLICLIVSLLIQVSISFAQQEILMNEEFLNNNNGWTEVSDIHVKAYVRDGKYTCDISKGTFFMDQLITVNLNANRDFVIESTLTKKRGDASYGISWGADGIGSRYNFMIFSKGTYSIQKWTNYDVYSYATEVPSYAIRPDFSPNTLSVRKVGNIVQFYINDAFLQEIPFEPLLGSRIGFYSNSGDLLVEAESYKIYYTSGSKIDFNKAATNRINIFVDSFNDNSKKWYECNQKDFFCKIKKGKYIIDYKAADWSYNVYNGVYLDPAKDYIVETNILKVDGSKDYGFGLTFGYKDPNNKYDFIIASNGSYKISKWNKSVASELVNWTSSKSINNGNGVSNKLSIKKEGKYLKFFINDIFVNQIPLPEFYGERLGFVVYKNQHIEIDDLQVYYFGGS
jgi:hypothetical protein